MPSFSRVDNCVPLLTLLLLVAILGIQSPSVTGLQCWVCTGNTTPLCQPGKSLSEGHNNVGVSEPCPYSNDVGTNNVTDDPAKWSCMIMETVVKSTERVEITKGCVRHFGAFLISDRIKDLDSKYFKPTKVAGAVFQKKCYTHDNMKAKREVNFHEITVCLCKEDNCNKRELTLRTEKGAKIREVGFGDIEQKLSTKISGACTLKISLIIWPFFVILMNMI